MLDAWPASREVEKLKPKEPCVPVSALRVLLEKAACEYNYLYAHAVLRDGVAALCDQQEPKAT